MTKRDDKLLNQTIIQQLDQAADSLDGATHSRLNQARQKALAQATPRTRPIWAWGGLATAAASALLVVTLWQGSPEPGLLPQPLGEDLEILASEDELELLEELEFYQWLEQKGEGPV